MDRTVYRAGWWSLLWGRKLSPVRPQSPIVAEGDVRHYFLLPFSVFIFSSHPFYPSAMLQRWLLIWLLLLSLTAGFWPELSGGLLSFDPFVATKEYRLLRPVFAVAMFCIGCLLPRDEIRQLQRRWDSVLSGTALQYLVMPVLAYAAAHLFGLSADMTIGVILVGCVPGAMASNVLTLAARGNVSYSVSLTTSATLLSPLVVPLVLSLTLGASQRPDPLQVFLNLLTDVVGPVIAGFLLSRRFAFLERVMTALGPTIANLAILWIIATVVGISRQQLLHITPLVLLALLTVNVLGYSAGFSGGALLRLPLSMRKALTLEIGMQNAGLGSVMALHLFPHNPGAAIPPAAYTFGCMLTGTLLAQYWSRRDVFDSEGSAQK